MRYTFFKQRKPLVFRGATQVGKSYLSPIFRTVRCSSVECIPYGFPRRSMRTRQSYFYLAKAYSLSREYKKAVSAYNKVIKLAPESFLADEAKQEVGKTSKSW